MSVPDRNRALGDIAANIMRSYGKEPANPEVMTTRDRYEREDMGKSTEILFYHGNTRHCVTLTRTQAEALLHQLEAHLYGAADRAGYTKLAPNQVVVQLPPEVVAALRAGTLTSLKLPDANA